MPKTHSNQFKTLKKGGSQSKVRRSNAGTLSGRSKIVFCGPTKKMSMEELLAEDAAFLAHIGSAPKARRNSVALVREGRL